MQRMQTVTVPGTAIRAQVPASYTDAQVRKALALQYKKATGFGVEQAKVVNPINRPIPKSNEEYWKQRLAGQGNLKAGEQTWRDQATGALAGLAGGGREAYRIADKVTGVADFVPGVGDALGLNEAWGDLKRGVNTADPYTVGAAMLTGAATLLPGALDKPVRKGLGTLLENEDGAIRTWTGDNYLRDLSEHAESLYRETSMDRAGQFIPGYNQMADTRGDTFFADTPDLAIGQGNNRGVLLEFDPTGLKGQVHTGKPTWQHEWEQGRAEYVAKYNPQSAYQQNLRAMTLKPDAATDKVTRARMERTLRQLEAGGWLRETGEDGATTYRRP